MPTEPFASVGNNLIGETDGSSGWVWLRPDRHQRQPLNPLLAPLGNYGGPTQTMALLPGSPAIDAGNNALIPIRRHHRPARTRLASSTAPWTSAPSSRAGSPSPSLREAASQQPYYTAFSAPLVVTVTANNRDRARGGGPGHIHSAGERGLGHAEWKPGDDQLPTARRASPPRPTASAVLTPSRPRPAASRPPRASA